MSGDVADPAAGGDPTGRSDADLLAAHVRGDPDAFGLLFARHRDRLWAVAVRTMGNREDAADAMQDALVSAYRRAGSFRGDSAVTTWLHRVVVNACLDRLRAAKVRRAEPLPDDLDDRRDRGSHPVTAKDDPAEASLLAERRRTVVAALQTLPAEQRAAVVLVDMEGYPVAEAAVILGCAIGTVKSRCARGRSRLAGMLGDLVADPGDAGGTPGRNPTATGAVETQDAPRGPPAE